MRAKKRRGFGWNRLSRVLLYVTLGYLMTIEFDFIRLESVAI